MGVTMTHASYADPRNEVDVLVSVLIGDDLIETTGDCNAGIKRDTLEAWRDVLLFFLENFLRLRSPLAPTAEILGMIPEPRKFLWLFHGL